MARALGITIELTFNSPGLPTTGIPAQQLLDAVTVVNDAVYRSELHDLRDVGRLVEGIPRVALDAAEHRVAEFKRSAISVRSARSGSLVIEFTVAGIVVWFLQQTLGETISQAWADTDLHRRLKDFLLIGQKRKVDRLGEDIRRRLERKLPAQVEVIQPVPGAPVAEPSVLRISMQLTSTGLYVPARGSILPE